MVTSVHKELKELYLAQEFSDITLKIRERETNEAPIIIKAHRIILAFNSPFFKRRIAENDREKGSQELIFDVDSGESRLVEIIVSSFYDKKIFQSLSTPDLIHVLQLSFLYANSNIVEEMCPLLEHLEPDFKISNSVLRGIHLLDRASRIEEGGSVSKVRSKYTRYLSEYFSPVEERTQTHTDFLALNYGSLWCLLECGSTLAYSENALLTFVLEWFKRNFDQQTGDNIKELLLMIRVKYLDAAFLHEVITLKNEVLNKWDGFPDWICDCLGYLARSLEERKWLSNTDGVACRNADLFDFYRKMSEKRETLCAVRWMVHMTPVKENVRFEPTSHLLVHDRNTFTPETVIATPMEEKDGMNYDLTLKVSSSFSLLGMQFVLGLVPADCEYDMSKMFFCSSFAKSFLKWTDSVTENVSSVEFSFWSASNEFMNLANQNGLYVCIFPFTDEEYKIFSPLTFYNSRSGSKHSVYRGTDAVHYSSNKIKLVPSKEYSG